MSGRRVNANKQNALQSTGPRTVEGKIVSSQNSRTHGLLSTKPVIPGLERPEDWEAHRAGVFESLLPRDYFETVLVERVALLSWRLGRAARFEAEQMAILQETVEEDLTREREQERRWKSDTPWGACGARYDRDFFSDHPVNLRSFAEIAEELRNTLERFLTLSESKKLPIGEAMTILSAIGRHCKIDETDLPLPEVSEDVDPWKYEGWTSKLVRRGIEAIAKQVNQNANDLVQATLSEAVSDVSLLTLDLHRVETQISRQRRTRVLPDEEILGKVVRYEAHLERSLYRTMHELERRQALRQGKPVLPPLAVDIDIGASSPFSTSA